MVYKKYEYETFRIFTLKTDQFKNCHMEVVFQSEATKNTMCAKSFLSEILSYSTKKFPTRKELVIRLEELYNSYYYGVTSKVGKTLLTNFVFDFLDPEYVKESDYLDDCMEFLFDSILNPNINEEGFDYTTFQVIKNRLQSEIESLKENPTNYSLRRSLKEIYPESISSESVLGNVEELFLLTPESLLGTYKSLLENSYCDIYIIGNLDMADVVKKIKKYFRNPVIKTHEQKMFVQNKRIKSSKNIVEEGKFVQSSLVLSYQLQGFTKKEYDFGLSVFSELFCGSSLNSKLYKYLRNQNSLCYRVQTIYQKYDELLLISVGLESKNKSLAIKLIKKALNEMETGKFTEEEFENAKKQLIFSLTMSSDNQNSIVNSYLFHNLSDSPLMDDRKKGIMEITKEDVIKIAKKLKLGLIYELKEVSHEGN